MRRKRNSGRPMKLLVPWLLFLLVTLLSVQIAAGTTSSDAKPKKNARSDSSKYGPDIKLLERGDPAPWFGILVPEKKYSIDQQDLAACEVIKEGYVMCSEAEDPPSGWEKFVYGAFIGAAATAVLTLGLHK